jgi:hypothetical protein
MKSKLEAIEAKKADSNFRERFKGDIGYETFDAMQEAFLEADGNTSDEKFIDACFACHTAFEIAALVACSDDDADRVNGAKEEAASDSLHNANLMGVPWNFERAA